MTLLINVRMLLSNLLVSCAIIRIEPLIAFEYILYTYKPVSTLSLSCHLEFLILKEGDKSNGTEPKQDSFLTHSAIVRNNGVYRTEYSFAIC